MCFVAKETVTYLNTAEVSVLEGIYFTASHFVQYCIQTLRSEIYPYIFFNGIILLFYCYK